MGVPCAELPWEEVIPMRGSDSHGRKWFPWEEVIPMGGSDWLIWIILWLAGNWSPQLRDKQGLCLVLMIKGDCLARSSHPQGQSVQRRKWSLRPFMPFPISPGVKAAHNTEPKSKALCLSLIPCVWHSISFERHSNPSRIVVIISYFTVPKTQVHRI